MSIEEFCKENKKKVHISIRGQERLFKEAESMLDDNEEVLYAIMYLQNLEFKILVITTKKVYTVGGPKGLSITSELLYLKDITSIDNKKGGFFKSTGGILINGVSQCISIVGINVSIVVDEIRKIILKAKENLESDNNINNQVNNLNYLEELEKLADLKDKGILSEEEFNTKKQQILDSNK